MLDELAANEGTDVGLIEDVLQRAGKVLLGSLANWERSPC
jgi:hypothetical protein